MISLTFSSGPWGPKCLKYQNVPNLGSFWAIGKPWERFQSGDIRIYFIPVPKDHTVVCSLIFSIVSYTNTNKVHLPRGTRRTVSVLIQDHKLRKRPWLWSPWSSNPHFAQTVAQNNLEWFAHSAIHRPLIFGLPNLDAPCRESIGISADNKYV